MKYDRNIDVVVPSAYLLIPAVFPVTGPESRLELAELPPLQPEAC